MTIKQISEFLEAAYFEAFYVSAARPVFNVILPSKAYHFFMKELIETYGGGTLRKPGDFAMPLAKDKIGYVIDSERKWHTSVSLDRFELRVREGDIFSAQLINKQEFEPKVSIGIWEQLQTPKKRYRSECTCGCHSNLHMMHIAPCCYPDPPATILTPEQLAYIRDTSDEGYYGGPECPNSWQLGERPTKEEGL